jgi:polyphosphate glucokinase
VIVLGIDIGGSGIKGALVDTTSGELVSERLRIKTPRPAKPKAVSKAVARLVAEFDSAGPIGCCFPTVVRDGVAHTESNLHEAWPGTSVVDRFSDATGRPFFVLNDADAAGLAEMRFGAGRELDGLVMVITVGTGIGSGLFYHGRLVPNLEIGHMPHRDRGVIEKYASDRARKDEDLSWDAWGKRFNHFLERTARVMTPDHFIVGGGASKRFDRFEHRITIDVPVHIAQLRNNAGIVGAAMRAAEEASG